MLTDVIWQFSESAGVLGPFEMSVCIFNALFFLFGCCSCTDFISLKLVVWRAETDHGGHLTAEPWGSVGLSLWELGVAEWGVSQGVPHGCGHRVVVPDGPPSMALEAQKKCWSSPHHLSLPQDGILSMPHQMTTPPPLGSAVWLREASNLPIPLAGASVEGHWLWPSGPCHGQAATSRARPALMFNCWARGDLSCRNKQVLKIGSKMRVKSIAHRTDGFGANTGHGQVPVGNWTERPCSGGVPCMTP